MPRLSKPASAFRCFISSPEVNRLVVMLYVGFPQHCRRSRRSRNDHIADIGNVSWRISIRRSRRRAIVNEAGRYWASTNDTTSLYRSNSASEVRVPGLNIAPRAFFQRSVSTQPPSRRAWKDHIADRESLSKFVACDMDSDIGLGLHRRSPGFFMPSA